MESERDAHLTAAGKYANQLQLIQKKSSNKYTLGNTVDTFDRSQTSDVYADADDGIDLNDKLQQQHMFDTSKPTHFHQHQSWPFGSGISSNRFKTMSTIANEKATQADTVGQRKNYAMGDMTSLSEPQSHSVVLQPAPHRPNQQQQQHRHHQQTVQEPTDITDSFNDLDWMAANNGAPKSILDYDVLYDDVNVNKRSVAMEKFDHYHQSDYPQLKTMMQSSSALRNKQRQ